MYIAFLKMEPYHTKLFIKNLEKYLKSIGLIVEKNDNKYFVARGLDYVIIVPKIKTEEFIRIMIVEYDSHIVKNITYSGFFYKTILQKFKKEFNKYILAKQ